MGIATALFRLTFIAGSGPQRAMCAKAFEIISATPGIASLAGTLDQVAAGGKLRVALRFSVELLAK